MHNQIKLLHNLTASILFLLLSLCNLSTASPLPNLQLYTPSGWSSNLILSTTNFQVTDQPIIATDSPISTKQPKIYLYLTLAIANYNIEDVNNTGEYTDNSNVSLYIDNQLLLSNTLAPIPARNGVIKSYPFINNYCQGDHSLRVELDSTNIIAESNESDNSYIRSFSIDGDGFKVSPAKRDYGNIPILQTFSQKFLFTYDGCDTIIFKEATIKGADSSQFTIINNDCTDTQLSFSYNNSYTGSCVIEVSFSPDSIGVKNSSLQITTEVFTSEVTTIPLSGRGVIGDFDGNGMVNITDITSVLKLLTDTYESTAPSNQQDVTGDHQLDLADAIYILNTLSKQSNVTAYKTAKLSTKMGDILIWLYDKTPKHRDNFLSLIENGFYNNLLFHRVIDGFMIQGGDPDGNGSGGPGYTIPAEIDNSLSHVYGAVAAARLGDSINPDKNSSGSQFYIVENPEGTHFLDNNYTVFGQVISGMPIVETFAKVPKYFNDKPKTDLVILEAKVIELTNKQLNDTYNFTIPTP